MKARVWILSLCLWLPQAWAQKVQIFDARGGDKSTTLVPAYKPPEPPQAESRPAAQVPSGASTEAVATEATEEVAKKPPEPTQQEKDLEIILEAVRKGTSITQLMRDPVLRPKLVNAYSINPLTDLPEPLIRASVIGQFSSNAVGAWLIQNVPALQNFLVDFVRDPVALGTLLKILNHTDDLLFYANVSIVMFLVMYFLRRQVVFTMESRFKRIVVRVSFIFIYWFGTYWAYSAKFGEYFEPTWAIFSKHFF